jgi:hypothetical protein
MPVIIPRLADLEQAACHARWEGLARATEADVLPCLVSQYSCLLQVPAEQRLASLSLAFNYIPCFPMYVTRPIFHAHRKKGFLSENILRRLAPFCYMLRGNEGLPRGGVVQATSHHISCTRHLSQTPWTCVPLMIWLWLRAFAHSDWRNGLQKLWTL